MSKPTSGYQMEHDAQDFLRATLPSAVSSCEQMEGMRLSTLRDRINSLEMQGYGLYIKQIFEDHPALLAVRMENTDNRDDNGRHIGFLVEDTDNGADWEALDEMLSERADYLNNAIRHRGIYDYIDNLLSYPIYTRDKIDQQLARAYDETFEKPGAWVALRADAEAAQLEHQTSTASTSTPRPRM